MDSTHAPQSDTPDPRLQHAEETRHRAERLLADGDMRVEVVKREINQGALAGMASEISDYGAALVIVALGSYDTHLAAELERGRRGRCLQHDVSGYTHPACGFHWHGRYRADVPTRDGEPVCPRCQLPTADRLGNQPEHREAGGG